MKAILRVARIGLVVAAMFATIFLDQVRAIDRNPPSSPSDVRVQRPSRADEVSQAVTFRRNLGLRSERSFVEGLYEDRSKVEKGSRNLYGALLTRAEVQIMEKWDQLSDAMPIVHQYVRRHGLSTVYAGLFIDEQDEGGIAHIGFTSDQVGQFHFQRIKELFPYPGRLILFTTEHSEAFLDDLLRVVTHDLDELAGRGIQVFTAAADVSINRVLITVAEADPATVSYLESRYGAHEIKVIEGTQLVPRDRFNEPAPVKAGIDIRTLTTRQCTAGWGVKSTINSNRFLMTAGHCFRYQQDADSVGIWRHTFAPYVNMRTLGNYHSDQYTMNSKCDCGFILFNNASEASYQLEKNNNVVDVMTSIQGTDTQGQAVCQSGVNSGVRCGTLLQQNVSVQFPDGMIFTNQRIADFFSQGGDSGGPVYRMTEIRGILSGGTEGNTSYSHVKFLQDYWPSRVILTN